MKKNTPTCLTSPLSGLPLENAGDFLMTEDGAERFQVKNGITCLLEPGTLDRFKKREMDIFDGLNMYGTPYFRNIFFKRAASKIISMLRKIPIGDEGSLIIAEMGGGEGHWARAIKKENPAAQVFICDLSMKTLERSPDNLNRIYADITQPIFHKNSVSLASFWVSLHHLNATDRINALKNIADSLEEEGVLLIFEPNSAFFPRKIIYNTSLRKDVYPDEHEQAINFFGISEIMKNLGLLEEAVYFINPPYNPDFIRKLKNWQAYMMAVEFLYQFEKWILNPVLGDIFSVKQCRCKKYLALYGFAVYRKRGR